VLWAVRYGRPDITLALRVPPRARNRRHRHRRGHGTSSVRNPQLQQGARTRPAHRQCPSPAWSVAAATPPSGKAVWFDRHPERSRLARRCPSALPIGPMPFQCGHAATMTGAGRSHPAARLRVLSACCTTPRHGPVSVRSSARFDACRARFHGGSLHRVMLTAHSIVVAIMSAPQAGFVRGAPYGSSLRVLQSRVTSRSDQPQPALLAGLARRECTWVSRSSLSRSSVRPTGSGSRIIDHSARSILAPFSLVTFNGWLLTCRHR
jgi:hypothetical protein